MLPTIETTETAPTENHSDATAPSPAQLKCDGSSSVTDIYTMNIYTDAMWLRCTISCLVLRRLAIMLKLTLGWNTLVFLLAANSHLDLTVSIAYVRSWMCAQAIICLPTTPGMGKDVAREKYSIQIQPHTMQERRTQCDSSVCMTSWPDLPGLPLPYLHTASDQILAVHGMGLRTRIPIGGEVVSIWPCSHRLNCYWQYVTSCDMCINWNEP